MTSPELKPCPFCGSDDVRQEYGAGAKPPHDDPYVICVDCGCSIAGMAGSWNRRADLAHVQPAQVRVKPLVWTGGKRVAATGLMLRMEGIFLDRDKVAQFEQERADEILSLLEPQPDPRDEVIKGLVEALEWYDDPSSQGDVARAALAAAKAVQHG